MVLPYLIDPSRRLATITLQGRVQGCDIAATIGALYGDSAWAAGYDGGRHMDSGITLRKG